jgi:hypothetical protein
MFTVNDKSVKLGMVVGIVGAIALFGLLFSLPVMWLWNGCLVPAVTGVNEISWLQSWGLMILANLFLKTSVSFKD